MNIKAKTETVTTKPYVNVLLWITIALLLTVGIVLNAYFAQVAASIRAALWIIGFLILGFVALKTEQGKAFFEFVTDARMELRKVVWPLREQTVKTTGLVIVAVIIFALILWAIDSTLLYIVTKLIG